jgi:transcriptional regulator GlxA family with amidase domain
MRRIVFLTYSGFELLDLSGPAAVFSMVGTVAGVHYPMACFSPEGGMVRSGCGIEVASRAIPRLRLSARDTVLVMGAEAGPLSAVVRHPKLLSALRSARKRAERVGSVCTGAFILASSGVLDDHDAATHWAGCSDFAEAFPAVRLHPDALYIECDGIWTSAGASTGIDMALAIVSRDVGTAVMGEVAKRLVVYAHRPGRQSQFSSLLAAQTAVGGTLSAVVDFIESSLKQSLPVSRLAEEAGMTERTFYRRFVEAIGLTPAQYVDGRRLERAKSLLEAGAEPKTVGSDVGFRSEGGFRAAFVKRFGLSPAAHRMIHNSVQREIATRS